MAMGNLLSCLAAAQVRAEEDTVKYGIWTPRVITACLQHGSKYRANDNSREAMQCGAQLSRKCLIIQPNVLSE